MHYLYSISMFYANLKTMYYLIAIIKYKMVIELVTTDFQQDVRIIVKRTTDYRFKTATQHFSKKPPISTKSTAHLLN